MNYCAVFFVFTIIFCSGISEVIALFKHFFKNPNQPLNFCGKQRFYSRTLSFGFTLIELLLVISIVSVLTLLGLSISRQHLQETKVEKAVIQIQQLLQAAAIYYIDHQGWPLKSDADKFKNKYVPAGKTKDPWGNDYEWCPSDASGQCYDDPTRGTFQVKTAANLSDKIAYSIKTKLPNAAIGGSGTSSYVYTQIAAPVQAYFPELYVAKIGQLIKINYLPPIPINCPPDYISKIHFNMLMFQTPLPNPYDETFISYIRKSPSITANGGCLGDGSKCAPYNISINTEDTGFKCSGAARFNKSLIAYPIFYSCTPIDFYSQYVINYIIYCCKKNSKSCT